MNHEVMKSTKKECCEKYGESPLALVLKMQREIYSFEDFRAKLIRAFCARLSIPVDEITIIPPSRAEMTITLDPDKRFDVPLNPKP